MTEHDESLANAVGETSPALPVRPPTADRGSTISGVHLVAPFQQALTIVAGGRQVDIEREGASDVGELSVDEMLGIIATLGDARARDEARCSTRPAFLVDYPEAARLLGTTVSALKTRVSRGDHRLHSAMVTNGRRVQFNVAKLSEKFTPRRVAS